jgi:NAD+ synthase (glutamine-hydrolysing)
MKKIPLRIALAQINPAVGDLDGNIAKILGYVRKAKDLGADIIAFPELAVCGYPPEDLLIKPKFVKDNIAALKLISREIKDIVAIVGFVDTAAKGLYNAAAVIYSNEVKGVYHKMLLPNYGVFDEQRYFLKGLKPLVFNYGGMVFGINICEDIWHLNGPTKSQVSLGAQLIINISSSPYHTGKTQERFSIIQGQAKRNRVAVACVNLVGGQDELVFDGQSLVVDAAGKILARAAAFKEEMPVVDIALPAKKNKTKKAANISDCGQSQTKPSLPIYKAKSLEPLAEIYQALSLGLYDYIHKNGFQKVVIGLSGGIDSSLVSTIAVDALGKENVTGVFMPSHYSSKDSQEDSKLLAVNLGIKHITMPIDHIFKIYLMTLEQQFAGQSRNIAEENLQARIRATLLMALSNKFGWLVLTTGNKSEISTGYATLYGDMAGGFAVIKDVPKTLVYKLARYRNSLKTVIPERTFTKAPTAELKMNQKDADTLPEYDVLDPILKLYVEDDKDLEKISALGFDKDTVGRVLRMVDSSEYKRRQAPPGVKITLKAFGKDRRMPITNKYKGNLALDKF